MSDKTREAFEAWWKSTMNIAEMDLHRNVYPMNQGWSYACHETNRAWMAWQAALAQQPAPVAVPDAMASFADDDVGRHAFSLGWNACRAAMLAAPAAPVAVGQEPVAYCSDLHLQMLREGSAFSVSVQPPAWRDTAIDKHPLYAAPPAAEQPNAAVMPCGAAVSNVYEAYEAGKKAAAQPDTVRTLLDESDMHWLLRFQECCEDPDADGHDLPKSAVRDLQLIGALRNVGFGRSEITKFGEYLLAGGDKP